MASICTLDGNCWEKMSKWLYASDLFSFVKCGHPVLNKKLTTAPVHLEFIADKAIFYNVKQLYRCIRLHFNKAQSAIFTIDFECMPSPDFMSCNMMSLLIKYGCVAESREGQTRRVFNHQTKHVLNIKSLSCGVRDSRAHADSEVLDKPASLMAFLLLQCARNYDLPVLNDVTVDPRLSSLHGPFFEQRRQKLVMFRDLSKCLTYVFVPSFLMDRDEYKLQPSACGEFLSDLCINFVAPDTSSRKVLMEDNMVCPSNQLYMSRSQFTGGQGFIDNLSKTLVCLDLQSPGPRHGRFVCSYSQLSPLLKELALGVSVTLILDMPLRETLEVFEVDKMRDDESHFQLTSLPKSLRRVLCQSIYQCDFKSDENWWHYWPEALTLTECTPRKLDNLISHFLPHIESTGCAFTLTDMILSNWNAIQGHKLLQARHLPVAPLLVNGILAWKHPVLPFPLDPDWLVGLTQPYLTEEGGGEEDDGVQQSAKYIAPEPNWHVMEMELDLSTSSWTIDSEIMLHRMVKRLIAIFPNVHRVAMCASRSDNAMFNFARYVDNNASNDFATHYGELASFSSHINPDLVENTQLAEDYDGGGSFDDDNQQGRKSRSARKRAMPLFDTRNNATDIDYEEWSDYDYAGNDNDWPIEMGGDGSDHSQGQDDDSDRFSQAYSEASMDEDRLDFESNDMMAWADRAVAAYRDASPDERRLNGAAQSDEEMLLALRAEHRQVGNDDDTSGDDDMLLALRAASRKFRNEYTSSGDEDEVPRPSRLPVAHRGANKVDESDGEMPNPSEYPDTTNKEVVESSQLREAHPQHHLKQTIESDEDAPRPSRLRDAYREATTEASEDDMPNLSRLREALHEPIESDEEAPRPSRLRDAYRETSSDTSSSENDEFMQFSDDGFEDVSSVSDYSFMRDDTTTPPRHRPPYYPDEPYNSDDQASRRSRDATSSMMKSFFMSGLLHHTQPTSNDRLDAKEKASHSNKSKKTSQSVAYRQAALFIDQRSKPGRRRNLKDKMTFFLNRYLCKLPNLESLFCSCYSGNDVLRHLHLTKFSSSLKRLDLCNIHLNPTLLQRIQAMHLTTLNLSVSNESTPADANADFMRLVKSLPSTLRHLRIVRSNPVAFDGCFFQLANWFPPQLNFLSMEAFTVTRSQFLPLVHMFCGMRNRRFLSMVLLTRLMNKQILKEVVIPMYYATLMPL